MTDVQNVLLGLLNVETACHSKISVMEMWTVKMGMNLTSYHNSVQVSS